MDLTKNYFKKLLKEQEIPSELKNLLRQSRKQWQTLIISDVSEYNVRIYYAGSYKKGTMIRESFDLDLVVLYPFDTPLTLREIHSEVKKILKTHGKNPHEKNVALRCYQSYEKYGEFHIDVVPGKASDEHYEYAWLYKSQENRRIQTNIFLQSENVTETRRRNAIKLLKLWKVRNNMDCPTFILEILFIRYLETLESVPLKLEELLEGTFEYITDYIMGIRLVDPANTNNIVSNELNYTQKTSLYNNALETLNAKSWNQVFS